MGTSTIKAAKGFVYTDVPQGSQEWRQRRAGRVTASQLGRWLGVNKKTGAPLKARLDYEAELAFERHFGCPFSVYESRAMEEGRAAEMYMREQYASIVGNTVEPAGAFYNDYFMASPDGFVGDKGLVEFKWLYDTHFTDVLINGVPGDYYLQIQGQLYASGREWCDFVAGNYNTRHFKVIRVKRDPEVIKRIEESLPAVTKLTNVIDTDGLFEFNDAIKISGEPATEMEWT